MSPPSAPSQPPLNEAYDQPSNPINKNPSEANSSHLLLGPNVETRKAQDVTVEATPTALGYGVRDSSGDRRDEVGAPSNELDGEQMRAPGEGEVYAAQLNKTGFGEQGDLAAGLDRKREEQDRIKEERYGVSEKKDSIDVEGVVGGEGKGFVGTKAGIGGRAVTK